MREGVWEGKKPVLLRKDRVSAGVRQKEGENRVDDGPQRECSLCRAPQEKDVSGTNHRCIASICLACLSRHCFDQLFKREQSERVTPSCIPCPCCKAEIPLPVLFSCLSSVILF